MQNNSPSDQATWCIVGTTWLWVHLRNVVPPRALAQKEEWGHQTMQTTTPMRQYTTLGKCSLMLKWLEKIFCISSTNWNVLVCFLLMGELKNCGKMLQKLHFTLKNHSNRKFLTASSWWYSIYPIYLMIMHWREIHTNQLFNREGFNKGDTEVYSVHLWMLCGGLEKTGSCLIWAVSCIGLYCSL